MNYFHKKFYFLKVIVLVIGLLLPTLWGVFAPNAFAADTGWKVPTSTGDDHNQWATPTEAYTDNGAFANEDTDLEQQDYYNFTLGVPAGAIIDGIEVRLEASKCPFASCTASDHNIDADLSYDGGSNYSGAKSTPLLNTTDTNYTLGNSTDTWGRSYSIPRSELPKQKGSDPFYINDE